MSFRLLRSLACTALCAASVFGGHTASRAGDWPGWMGPERDNVIRETGLLTSFPKPGPTTLWRTPIAGGYAGPAVAEGKVFVTDFVRQGASPGDNFSRTASPGTERVLCLDEVSGKILWKQEYPVTYTISYPAGPRCTPLVDDGKVYSLGAEGNLFCFQVANGKVVWSKDLKAAYNTTAPLWGYAAHPLIDGDKLITLAGGKGSQIVALNKQTGKEIWRSQETPEGGQGYVPPSIIEAAGVRQLISMQPDALKALDPETGRLLWSVPYEANNGSAIMTPVRSGDYLFFGGYNNRNLLAKLGTNTPTAETVWRDKARHGLSAINVQPFVVKDVMYGFDGSGKLMAVQIPSGERLWESAEPVGRRPVNSATAFIYRDGPEGDRWWMFNELGEILIAKLTPQGYEEIDRAKVIEPTGSAFGRDVVWCPPAFADGSLFVRNDKEIIRVDLQAK